MLKTLLCSKDLKILFREDPISLSLYVDKELGDEELILTIPQLEHLRKRWNRLTGTYEVQEVPELASLRRFVHSQNARHLVPVCEVQICATGISTACITESKNCHLFTFLFAININKLYFCTYRTVTLPSGNQYPTGMLVCICVSLCFFPRIMTSVTDGRVLEKLCHKFCDEI